MRDCSLRSKISTSAAAIGVMELEPAPKSASASLEASRRIRRFVDLFLSAALCIT
jgi:hypothetical protein